MLRRYLPCAACAEHARDAAWAPLLPRTEAAWLALWVVVIGLVAQAVLGLKSAWLLYLLVAAQSAGFAINNPARTAIIPRLVDLRLLPAANVLQTVAWNIALTVGPLLAAFLVAGPGFGAAYAVDATLFTAAL